MQLANHLGNVLTTISDKKFGVSSNGTVVDYFEPEMVSGMDYYAFGSPMRVAGEGAYRYGFNGQEMSNEIKGGEGNSYTAEFWEYDPRIGRRWNLDPKGNESVSPYSAFFNNPIYIIDPLGDTIRPYWHEDARGKSLSHKGGSYEDIANTLEFGGVRIVPQKSASHKMVGYYVYDNEVENARFPLLQMEHKDLGNFLKNYDNYVSDARNLYQLNFVESGQKKMIAALPMYDKLDMNLFWQGAKEVNVKAWSDPVFRTSFLTLSAGTAAHVKSINSLDDVFRNPNVLKGTSSEEIRNLAALDPRWKIGTLGKGNHAGSGLTVREWNKGKTDFTHRYIQFHPGTTRPNHFGGAPYWKVSGANKGSGIIKVAR